MINKQITILLLVLVLSCFEARGQDITLSQFFSSGVSLNPALAGSNNCPRLKLVRREQWPSIPNSYVNTDIMFDWYSSRFRSGLAVSFVSDRLAEGILNTNILNVFYSKDIQVNQNLTINGGLQAGYSHKKMDWNKLRFSDQLDFQYGFVNPTQLVPPENRAIHFPDFATGITIDYMQKLYSGIAVSHLHRPYISFYGESEERLNRKYSGHLGYVIYLQDSWRDSYFDRNATISPIILFEMQGAFKQVIAGGYFNREPVMAGVLFRHTIENIDAAIIMLGFNQPRFRIHYSFDITLSSLTLTSSGGAHELGLTWLFACPVPFKERIRQVRCAPFLR